jgi:cell migration-inducing and hyaluronan-binding protein
VNYQDNERRTTGALSWLLYTSSGVTTTNTIKGAKFVNAKPVNFPKYDARFDNDNRGGVAWRTAVIHDLDGSVGGIRNSYILIHDGENDSVATDDTCKIQRTWNAAVCTGDVGRLFLNKPGGTLAQLSAGAPVTLHRNGKDHRITGNQSNVRSGTEMRVNTEREEISLSVREMDKGSWVVFELPGFTNAASGKQQASMDALRKASETSYFKDKDGLWVKLIVTDADFQGPVVEPVGRLVAQASMTVSR